MLAYNPCFGDVLP
jgi:serine/threonine protein kinase